MSGNNELTVLDKLEAESEIRKLMNFYSKISDAFKWEEWSECFTEDSLFDFRLWLMGGKKFSKCVREIWIMSTV